MLPRLLECGPIKYSCRQRLENDLCILAAACNHKVLKDNNLDLEEMIRKKKDDWGKQWRKSLGDGPVTNNRHPSTNHPLSPNVTSRFSPYRRESPSSYRHQPAPYGNLWPVATSTPNRHYGKYTSSPSDSA